VDIVATITANIESSGSKSLDLSTPSDRVALATSTYSFADGTGALSAEQHYHDRITLTHGASTEVDLFDTLLDAFGDTVSFTKIKVLYLKNNSDAATLIYGHSAANALAIMETVGDGGLIGPGGVLLLINPSAAGFACSAGNDLLKLEHDDADASDMDVDLYVLGEVT